LPAAKEPLRCGQQVVIGIRPEHISIVAKENAGSLLAHIEFIDNMGADKLVQTVTASNNLTLLVRVFDDIELPDNGIGLEMDLKKASVFCQLTGVRLGGWNE